MFDLGWLQWLIVSLCAVMVGMTKTGIPGLSVLAVPLMVEVFPARASTGIMLPMLIFADVFAILYYRRHVVWSHLLRVLPWTATGVVIGYLLLGWINDRELKSLIGIIILVILSVEQWRDRKAEATIPRQWWFAASFGLLAGVTTMMANAAGPFVTIYLLSMRLPKIEFMGISAWYYFILNWFKVPFSFSMGLINSWSLQLDFVVFPMIAVGAILGAKILKNIPQKRFKNLLQILAAAAAITLLF